MGGGDLSIRQDEKSLALAWLDDGIAVLFSPVNGQVKFGVI